MSANLLDLAKGYLTNEVVAKASGFIGEDQTTTQSAFDHILPTLLGGMVTKANDKSGASDLFGMVTRPEFGGGLLNNLGDLFSQTETSNNAMNLGGSLLTTLMGNRTNNVVDIISSAVGMKSNSTNSLLKMALPILLSVIGKKVKTDGLGLDGFMNLIQDQDKYVKEAAPAGFLDKMLGAFGVSGLGAGLGKAASSAKERAQTTASRVTDTAKAATSNVRSSEPESSSKSGLARVLPILLILGALLLAWWLWRSCETEAVGDDLNDDQIEQSTDTTEVDSANESVYSILGNSKPTGEYNEQTNRYVFNTGDMIDLELPNGETVQVAENGAANTLYKLINSNDFVVSGDKSQGWFTLDGVYFETGSANLDQSSNAKLETIATILEAYPAVNLKFGGYTDNSGSRDMNVQLSQNRAEAAMNKVVSSGVDAARLAAEGYGPDHPVCPANDTPSCMAQNRRVDVRITQK